MYIIINCYVKDHQKLFNFVMIIFVKKLHMNDINKPNICSIIKVKHILFIDDNFTQFKNLFIFHTAKHAVSPGTIN